MMGMARECGGPKTIMCFGLLDLPQNSKLTILTSERFISASTIPEHANPATDCPIYPLAPQLPPPPTSPPPPSPSPPPTPPPTYSPTNPAPFRHPIPPSPHPPQPPRPPTSSNLGCSKSSNRSCKPVSVAARSSASGISFSTAMLRTIASSLSATPFKSSCPNLQKTKIFSSFWLPRAQFFSRNWFQGIFGETNFSWALNLGIFSTLLEHHLQSLRHAVQIFLPKPSQRGARIGRTDASCRRYPMYVQSQYHTSTSTAFPTRIQRGILKPSKTQRQLRKSPQNDNLKKVNLDVHLYLFLDGAFQLHRMSVSRGEGETPVATTRLQGRWQHLFMS